MGAKYLVTKNIFYNLSGQAILIILGFLTTPFIIHKLGTDAYGVFSLITAVVSYFAILDLGLGASIIKFIAQYTAQNDQENLEKIITTALTIYLSLGIFGGMLILIFTYFFVARFLHIPNYLIPVSLTAFYLSSLGFLINMVATVFNAIPNGLQKMAIVQSRNIFFELVSTIGIVLILFWGGNLVSVIIWNIIVSLLVTIVFFWVIKKILPKVSLRPSFDQPTFFKLLKFGGFKFISNIAGLVVFQLDKLLISFFNPVAAVTFYTTPTIIVQRGLGIMHNITDAVFPAISFAGSLEQKERVQKLYLRSMKLITLCSVGMSALFFIFAKDILLIWLGADFAHQSSLVLQILSLAYFLAAISAPAVIAADGLNRPQIPATFALISAVINLLAALILILRFGIVGAAEAILINFILQIPLFIFWVNKYVVKISPGEFLTKSILRPILAGFLAGALASMVVNFNFNPWLEVILGGVIFAVSYFLINFIIGSFDQDDKILAQTLWKKLR